MDDRSIKAQKPNAEAKLDAALQATLTYDTAIGYVENAKKRQRWSRRGNERIEHLGVTCVPSQASEAILTRGG
jgi:hypothetical protein